MALKTLLTASETIRLALANIVADYVLWIEHQNV